MTLGRPCNVRKVQPETATFIRQEKEMYSIQGELLMKETKIRNGLRENEDAMLMSVSTRGEGI